MKKEENGLERERGVLLHISSLPNRDGIGGFGKSAYEFCDKLHEAGLTLWQVLPLCPTSYGDSPYQSPSAFAGNPNFIDLERLTADGLLEERDWLENDWESGRVDYEKVFCRREKVLRKAFGNFDRRDVEFVEFCGENKFWLDDYACFMSIKSARNMASWDSWGQDYGYEGAKKNDYASDGDFWRWTQYEFFKQWASVRQYAKSLGIEIIGDMPIYVAYDSADVWANSQMFLLGEDNLPTLVAGVPPDSFSADGQLWGNPLYDWEKMRKNGYDWWISRIKMAMKMYDIVRIDHFRGFESYYAIPFGEKTAERGEWKKGVGIELFRAIKKALPNAKIIAEDLGFLDENVRKMVRDSGYPSMKVMQFGFGGDKNHEYLPKMYPYNCIAYTGTHDNDTTLGWFKALKCREKWRVRRFMRCFSRDIVGAMIKQLFGSSAKYAVVPMQDMLRLDSFARMNTPSTSKNNWQWRMTDIKKIDKFW